MQVDSGLFDPPRVHGSTTPSAGTRAPRRILLLHGWPDSWFSYSRVLAHLPPRYRALVIDQRGFGDSERPESGYAIEDLASDAVAFLHALRIERATVVGTPWAASSRGGSPRSIRSVWRGWSSSAAAGRAATR